MSEGDRPAESLGSDSDVVYGLNSRPPLTRALFVALQHLLAIFVPILTPSLIVCGALNFDADVTRHVVGMSLFISGIATFIQVRGIGPVGTGMLSIQGTSFTFINTIIAMGRQGGLPLILGVCMAGSVVEMVISRFIPLVRKVISRLVSGIVVTLIGLTLIKVGIVNCAGGEAVRGSANFGSMENLGIAFLTLAVIVGLNATRSQILRISSIALGMAVGYMAAAFRGMVDFSDLAGGNPWLIIPMPLKYGVDIHWAPLLPMGLLYMVTAVESFGDITATSVASGEPIRGQKYLRRISGGILGDGLNSLLAGLFCTFPNTTFSQNNGIIQLTGVASRYVGFLVAGFLALLGLSPLVSGIFARMPAPVLGGGTLVMFGTVAAAGIRIIALEKLDRRALIILAASFSLGLGVVFEPDILQHLPEWARHILYSGIVTGGVTAILCNVLLPGRKSDG